MITYYYGYGKGKTTAAMGSLLRACGAGMRCALVQFLKDGASSELRALPAGVTVFPSPQRVPFVQAMSPRQRADYADWVQGAWTFVQSFDGDFLVLDELGGLISCGLLSAADAASILKQADYEVIATGHEPCRALQQAADYVTCFQKEKHPFDLGIGARYGIEF